MNTWINSKQWKENWRCIKELSSGAQAIAKYVENSKKQTAFLNMIKN
jgi:hypothetical protein